MLSDIVFPYPSSAGVRWYEDDWFWDPETTTTTLPPCELDTFSQPILYYPNRDYSICFNRRWGPNGKNLNGNNVMIESQTGTDFRDVCTGATDGHLVTALKRVHVDGVVGGGTQRARLELRNAWNWDMFPFFCSSPAIPTPPFTGGNYRILPLSKGVASWNSFLPYSNCGGEANNILTLEECTAARQELAVHFGWENPNGDAIDKTGEAVHPADEDAMYYVPYRHTCDLRIRNADGTESNTHEVTWGKQWDNPTTMDDDERNEKTSKGYIMEICKRDTSTTGGYEIVFDRRRGRNSIRQSGFGVSDVVPSSTFHWERSKRYNLKIGQRTTPNSNSKTVYVKLNDVEFFTVPNALSTSSHISLSSTSRSTFTQARWGVMEDYQFMSTYLLEDCQSEPHGSGGDLLACDHEQCLQTVETAGCSSGFAQLFHLEQNVLMHGCTYERVAHYRCRNYREEKSLRVIEDEYRYGEHCMQWCGMQIGARYLHVDRLLTRLEAHQECRRAGRYLVKIPYDNVDHLQEMYAAAGFGRTPWVGLQAREGTIDGGDVRWAWDQDAVEEPMNARALGLIWDVGYPSSSRAVTSSIETDTAVILKDGGAGGEIINVTPEGEYHTALCGPMPISVPANGCSHWDCGVLAIAANRDEFQEVQAASETIARLQDRRSLRQKILRRRHLKGSEQTEEENMKDFWEERNIHAVYDSQQHFRK